MRSIWLPSVCYNFEGATYGFDRGPKGLYTVIEWTDGRSLFLDGDSEESFMDEYVAARRLQDNDHMERMFGIGSGYHGIADEVSAWRTSKGLHQFIFKEARQED